MSAFVWLTKKHQKIQFYNVDLNQYVGLVDCNHMLCTNY